MGRPIQFTESHQNMLRDNNRRIQDLEEYKITCDELHKAGKEHRKRVDDSMDNLTSSNILLAKAVTDINIALSRMVSTVDGDRPTIKIIKDVGVAWDMNKNIFAGIVTLAGGCVAIAAALKYFS